MKKLILFVLALLTLSNAKSQISMTSNGNANISSVISTVKAVGETPNQANVHGSLYVTCVPSSSGISIKDYNYSSSVLPCILPQWNNTAMIGGSSSSQFFMIHSRYIYMNGALVQTSDSRTKTNIRPLNSSLNKVLMLKPIMYDFSSKTDDNTPEEMRALIEQKNKDQVGFEAQAMLNVIPALVHYDDSSDLYGIDYTKLTTYLVDAIQEQQITIESLQSEIQELKQQSGNSTGQLKSTSVTTNTGEISTKDENVLYANSPNPFTESTRIEYYLADNVQTAMINIYDMNGKQLKSIPLHLEGYGNITINGSELKAGMYMYSLLVDGKITDTKRMVLTD